MAPIVSAFWAIAALVIATAFPAAWWSSNVWHCSSAEDDTTCVLLPISLLLGTVIAIFSHSIFVAALSHSSLGSPLFRRLRSSADQDANATVKNDRSCFNSFLWLSIAFDVALWGVALSYISDYEQFLQAVVITFNAPLLVFLPYLFAAMRDPSASDIGSWLHFIQTEVSARLLEQRQRELVEAAAAGAKVAPQEQVSLLSSMDGASTDSRSEKAGWKMFAGV